MSDSVPADLSIVMDQLVGVIDVKAGQAVHAVAGQRELYRPVVLGNAVGCDDPVQLARHYYDLGVRQLYVADLDGITDGQIQASALMRLLDEGLAWDNVLLDVGCEGASEFATQLCMCYSATRFIVATEAAENCHSLTKMSDAIGPQRTILGLDYRSGVFVSHGDSEADFIAAANNAGVQRLVVLDVAAVGTGDASGSIDLCQRVKKAMPTSMIYSGGGIASLADVQSLQQAGSDYCLVATWLQN